MKGHPSCLGATIRHDYSYEERKQLLEAIRYVDLVIPEESWSQKKTDVHEFHVDTFVIGDDWEDKFDFLRDEGCEVVYLPRTPEISSSQMKEDLGRAGGAGYGERDYDGVDLSE